MVKLLFSLALVSVLFTAPCAAVAQLEGLVINETTGQHPAGDEIVLLSLSQEGMTEGAHSRTDGRGRFTLPVPDPELTHVIRVVHQGVTYHQVVEPGTRRVAIVAYDAANRVDGVTAVMDVSRFEATNDSLEVKQLVTMRNESRPPRTLMNDRTFEIQLPPGAVVESGMVQVEDGQPLKQKPITGDRTNQYYFSFPLRPGDTRFAVIYRLPYSGTAAIEPQLRNPYEKFVVMLPKSMKFDAQASGVFHPMPNTTPDEVQGTDVVTRGQLLAFRISGTGRLEELKGRRQEADKSKATSVNAKNSPGGGLGAPIEAPDPLQEYRWPILAVFAVLTAIGATCVVWKARKSSVTDPALVRKVRREVKQQTRAQARGHDRQRIQA